MYSNTSTTASTTICIPKTIITTLTNIWTVTIPIITTTLMAVTLTNITSSLLLLLRVTTMQLTCYSYKMLMYPNLQSVYHHLLLHHCKKVNESRSHTDEKNISNLIYFCGQFITYKIINDDSSIVNKFEASLTDDARVIIYDRNIFIIQTTGKIDR